MRIANATIYAAAALGLCLMSPQGAAASPAMPDMGKAYTQAAKGGNLTLARFGGRGHIAGVGHFRGNRFGAVGGAPLRHRARVRLRRRSARLLARPGLARWLLRPRPWFGLRLRPPRLLGRTRHSPRRLWRMGPRIWSWLGLGLACWPRARAGRSRDGLGLWWGLGLSRLLWRWLFPGLFRRRWLLRLVRFKSDPARAFALGEKWTANITAKGPRKRPF